MANCGLWHADIRIDGVMGSMDDKDSDCAEGVIMALIKWFKSYWENLQWKFNCVEGYTRRALRSEIR